MSHSSCSAPINISGNSDGPCELKCTYQIGYSKTTLIGRNAEEYLLFTPGIQQTAPVTYNSENYSVKEMRVYSPSLHTFGGKPAQAEIQIEHTSNTSSNTLMVCIPVETKGSTNTNFDELVLHIATYAPSLGTAGEISLPTLSFANFVPMKPYYSYTGTSQFSCWKSNYDYIVYPIEDALSMTSDTFKSLKKITMKKDITIKKPINGFYYNESGTGTKTGAEEDIYIECKPTGANGEDIMVDTKTSTSSSSSFDLSSFFDGDNFQKVIHIILGIFIIIVFYSLFNKFKSAVSDDDTASSLLDFKS